MSAAAQVDAVLTLSAATPVAAVPGAIIPWPIR
jgi:hypothetical protein